MHGDGALVLKSIYFVCSYVVDSELVELQIALERFMQLSMDLLQCDIDIDDGNISVSQAYWYVERFYVQVLAEFARREREEITLGDADFFDRCKYLS